MKVNFDLVKSAMNKRYFNGGMVGWTEEEIREVERYKREIKKMFTRNGFKYSYRYVGHGDEAYNYVNGEYTISTCGWDTGFVIYKKDEPGNGKTTKTVEIEKTEDFIKTFIG